MTTDACPAALELRDVVKHFDGVPALRGASLKVPRGTVHGLIGQNGAGKSTLIKILAGIHTADSGTIAVDGIAQAYAASAHSSASGIGFVHQDRLLPPTFTVAEALWLGDEKTIGPRVARGIRLLDVRRMQRDARDALHGHFGVDITPNRLIGDLSVAEQQIVQITRELIAIYRPSCNKQQYDQSWRDEWIGEYTAPTTGPVARRAPDGSDPSSGS